MTRLKWTLLPLVLLSIIVSPGTGSTYQYTHCDTFQYGLKPDTNFVGWWDTYIYSHATWEHVNFGVHDPTDSTAIRIGFAINAVMRGIVKVDVTAYIPARAVMDSAFLHMRTGMATVTADTIGIYFALQNWNEGIGYLGTGTNDDSLGCTWHAYDAAAPQDVNWNVAGADSAYSPWTWDYGLEDQIRQGALTIDGFRDRGPYPVTSQYVPVTQGWTVWNITTLMRAWHYGPDNGGVANRGMILRDLDETAGGGRWFSKETGGNETAYRPFIVVYWRDPDAPIHFGDDSESLIY